MLINPIHHCNLITKQSVYDKTEYRINQHVFFFWGGGGDWGTKMQSFLYWRYLNNCFFFNSLSQNFWRMWLSVYLRNESFSYWVHGGMNRSAGQTNRVNRFAVLVQFVCSALRFIPPMNPEKKDTHSLYLQCFQQGAFLKFPDKHFEFKIPAATST